MPEDDNGLARFAIVVTQRQGHTATHTHTYMSCSIRKSYVDFIRLLETLNHGGLVITTQKRPCGDVARVGWSQAFYYLSL